MLSFQLAQAETDKQTAERERDETRSQLSNLQSHLKTETEQKANMEKTQSAALQEKDIIISDKDTEIQVRAIVRRNRTPNISNNNNNNRIQRCNSRFFCNLLTLPRTICNMYAQVAWAQLCANHVQHIVHLSCVTCHVMCHVVWRDSSAIKFERV